MKNPVLLFLLPPIFACSAVAGESNRKLTLEQVSGRGDQAQRVNFSGRAPNWRWAADGERLLGPDDRAYHLRTGKALDASKPDDPPDEEAQAAKQALLDAFLKLEGFDAAAAERVLDRKLDSGAGDKVRLHGRGGKYWIIRDGLPERVEFEAEGGAPSLFDLSPDGQFLAYMRDHDLRLVSLEPGVSKEHRALTKGGGPSQFNGELDWVYQEEVYGRGNFKGFWWSPDSTRVALLCLDESNVYDFTVIDHIEPDTFRVKPEITRFPKAGDPNPIVRLGVIEIGSGAIEWADLSAYAAEEPLVVRVEWKDDRLLFVVQDRTQTFADLLAFTPGTGLQKLLIHEQNDTWTERPDPPRWLEDGSFLWFSDRTDQRHLYHYSKDGELQGAVTAGDWSVRRIADVDEERGLLWFTATKDGAVNDNLYRIGLDGRKLERLTKGDGVHSVAFNHDRSYFIDRFSSLSTPPSVSLFKGDGKFVRELGAATIKDLETYQAAKWELVEIRARDGFLLDAAVLKPNPLRRNRPHPVWLPTYSGPDAPTVRNRWSGSAWEQFLAQEGFIVFHVNVRTASGKGHQAIEQCYRQLGVQELRDLEDAVDWLTAHPWADRQRVGITGMSYGGFMTAFALTHSDRFALGIAESGVYDWGMYDTIYTERYMSTPQKNPEGYAAASVIKAAANLKGHMLITHGVMDDNVHVQNAMQLIFALQKADRDFDLMLYPESRHGIGDRDLRWHSRKLTWKKIVEHLGEPRAGGSHDV